jgi:hypothetical protein
MKKRILAFVCVVALLIPMLLSCDMLDERESTTPEEEITPAESTTPEEITTPEPDPFADFVPRPIKPLVPYMAYITSYRGNVNLGKNGIQFKLIPGHPDVIVEMSDYRSANSYRVVETNIPTRFLDVNGRGYELSYSSTKIKGEDNRHAGTRFYDLPRSGENNGRICAGFDVKTKDLVYMDISYSCIAETENDSTPVLDKDACRKIANDFLGNYVKTANRKIDLSDYTFVEKELKILTDFSYYEFAYYKNAGNGYIHKADHLTVRVTTHGNIVLFKCGDDLSHFEKLYPDINYELADQQAAKMAQQIYEIHESLQMTYTLTNCKEYYNPEGDMYYMLYGMNVVYEYEGFIVEGTIDIIIPL